MVGVVGMLHDVLEVKAQEGSSLHSRGNGVQRGPVEGLGLGRRLNGPSEDGCRGEQPFDLVTLYSTVLYVCYSNCYSTVQYSGV